MRGCDRVVCDAGRARAAAASPRTSGRVALELFCVCGACTNGAAFGGGGRVQPQLPAPLPPQCERLAAALVVLRVHALCGVVCCSRVSLRCSLGEGGVWAYMGRALWAAIPRVSVVRRAPRGSGSCQGNVPPENRLGLRSRSMSGAQQGRALCQSHASRGPALVITAYSSSSRSVAETPPRVGAGSGCAPPAPAPAPPEALPL